MLPTRRSVLASGLTLALAPWSRGEPKVPITGDRALAPFDELLTRFLTENKVPGAALAVARNGKLVHARGYGYADLDRKTPVEPSSTFRIASISKPLTAVAILTLLEQGKHGLDDRIRAHVRLAPLLADGAKMDPRWEKVTIRMLLQHTAGMDRAKSGDPIGKYREIAKLAGEDVPVRYDLVIRYALGRPLDFDPGERYAYSNVGYLLLGRAIEAASGKGFEEYVQKSVLTPLGITTTCLGRALPENRAPGEVSYYEANRGKGRCLYPPRRGEQVPLPDGAANFEAYEAHGGYIASAVDLVTFASAFHDPKRCPLLREKTIATMWERPASAADREVYYGCGWNYRPTQGNAWHSGLIPGTSTLLVRRGDGLCWAVLFNTERNAEGKILSNLIDGPLHEAAARVKQWP